MAARFTAISRGELGTSYTVEIHDSAYGGAATEIEIAGFSLLYDPDKQEDPITSIISSSLTFNINIQPSTQSAINTFIDDLVGADEGRFRIKVTKASAIFWVGFILTDQISIEDQNWADKVSTFTVTAVDGISRLKDMDYNDAGTAYTGRVTAREHLFNILDKIGTADFYGATENYLFIICRWYEDSMGAVVTNNPLSKTYIDHAVFVSTDTEGNEKFTSCYDVLKQLAQLFLCRFYYSAGVYRYDQIGEYREATVTRIKYYKGDTFNTSTTGEDLGVVENVDNIIRLGNVNGRFFYFAPAREIRLSFEHLNNRNYLSGYVWDADSDPAHTMPIIGREGISLWVRGKLRTTLDHTPDSNMEDCFVVYKFIMTAEVGGTTYYAKRDYTVNNGVITFGTHSWTTTATDRISVISSNMYLDNVEYTTDVDFLTAVLPGSAEFAEVTFDVDFHSVWKLDGITAVTPSYTETWRFENAVLQLVADDDSALTQKSVFTKTNADTPNASLVLEYETMVSDTPTLGTLFVPTNLTIDNGGVEEISDAWAKGVGGGGKKLHYLWLDEVMKLRTKALKRYEGQIRGNAYHPHNLYEFISGAQYVMQRIAYDSISETWSGDWWFVGYDDTITGTTLPVISEPGPPGGGGPPPGPPGGGPKIFNPLAGVSAPSGGVAALRGTGGHIVTKTSTKLTGGMAVTSIPINSCSSTGGLIKSGDTITVYNPSDGYSLDFTVTADVAAGDTTISVSSDTPTSDLDAGAYVVSDTCDFVSNIRSGTITRYSQTFVSTGVQALTVTANSGNLPSNTAQIEVYYGATRIFETDDWTVSGSVITLVWKPETGVKIRVFFWYP